MKNTQAKEWRDRLRFLADIIFATAMTLMVLNIEVPQFGHIDKTGELAKFLIQQLMSMGSFFIIFLVIAVYWIKHLEHFSMIPFVNQNFIWLQLIFLASILLLPFWNAYIEVFSENVAIRFFLSVNMLLVGVFSYLSLNYASNTKHRLLHSEVTTEELKEAKMQILTEPIIAALAAGLAFIDVLYWDLAFILVPILFALRRRLIPIKYFRKTKS
ncbi:TMEM175 family protein [Winogradskyella aurantiaca]|uniref:TMEM175 family protein n=1 Tax=Winogradskyella aurantiaca TaxID=2219558 RepID=UPI000E1DCF1A|nr:TMEM175 family protein [Winogradskyella aurantiaca]